MRRFAVIFGLLAPLGGCAVPQPQDTPVSEHYELDSVTGRKYWLYVPSNYRPDRPAPLIVSCHGTPPFDVARHHIEEWKMLGEQRGCIVLAPELSATDGILGDGPLVGMVANENYILSLFSLMCYRFNIDRNNVMITGFSGGGFPTYWVGLRHPDVFTVVVARNCNFSEWNLDNWYPPEAVHTSVMVYYGENDPGAIQAQSKAAIQYLSSKGFRVESAVILGSGHQRHPEVAMQFFCKNWRAPKPTVAAVPPPAER
jgi:poly(3-hydroxybutyrate) depolymerase